MSERHYRQAEVHKIFSHIPTRTLKSWVELGLVGWTDERQDGRGIHRIYGLENLREFAIVNELSGLNFPVRFIKGIMKYLAPVNTNMTRILPIHKTYAILLPDQKLDNTISFSSTIDPSELQDKMAAWGDTCTTLVNLPRIANLVNDYLKALN